MKNILLLDASETQKNGNVDVSKILTEKGYNISKTFNGNEALKEAETNNYDLIIINNKISDMSDTEFFKKILNKEILCYIIVLSPINNIENKIKCLDAGADDYIITPFDERELYARIRVLTRRINTIQEIFKLDDLIVNTTLRIIKRSKIIIDLTAREYNLLAYLIKNKGKVLSRLDISINVWGINFDTGTNTIDVYIKYLREKLDIGESRKSLIHTIYGLGYVMDVRNEGLSS